MAAYSIGNYFASLTGNLSLNAIPVIITAITNPQNTAHYAIAMSFAALLFSIPTSVCNSLFAEGAVDEKQTMKVAVKAVKMISILLFPIMIILMLFGKSALLLFGMEYAENSATLLSILAISSVFVSINSICWTLLNLQHRISEILMALGSNAFLVLALTFIWTKSGLTGNGLAWLVGQGLTSLIYIALIFRNNLKNRQYRGMRP